MAEAEERELWGGRPSWRGRMAILIPGILIVVLVLIIAIWAGASATLLIALTGIAAIVVFIWTLLDTFKWKYAITDRRVFVRHGLVSVKEQTARLERVQDVTLHQTLFDRMFGVGRLLVDTAGTSGGALEFKALVDPAHVREILDNAVRAERHEHDPDASV